MKTAVLVIAVAVVASGCCGTRRPCGGHGPRVHPVAAVKAAPREGQIDPVVPSPQEAPVPAWSGQDLAATEYADMVRHGTPIERRWAATARDRASVEARRAMDAALDAPEPRSADGRDAPAAEGEADTPVQIDLRIYDFEPLRNLSSSLMDRLWERQDIQSDAGRLGTSEQEILDEFIGREPERHRLMDRRTLQLRGGEATSYHLPGDCVLRLRLSGAERFHVAAGVRYKAADEIVFAPALDTTMRRTWSLLLTPRDTLAPAPERKPLRLFILTLRADASPPASSGAGLAK